MTGRVVVKTEDGLIKPLRNRLGVSGRGGQLLTNPAAWLGGFLMLLLVTTAWLAPVIAPYPYDKINPTQSLQSPSWQHLFGTDKLGRDMFSRVVFGAQLARIHFFGKTVRFVRNSQTL